MVTVTAAFMFFIYMTTPTFGPQEIRFATDTMEHCEKMRNIIVKQMDGLTMKYAVTPCKESK